MKLLVFSTVIPTKKNLRVKTFETLHKALKKRIPTELIWVVYQPDQFEKIMMDGQTIYCLQDLFSLNYLKINTRMTTKSDLINHLYF